MDLTFAELRFSLPHSPRVVHMATPSHIHPWYVHNRLTEPFATALRAVTLLGLLAVLASFPVQVEVVKIATTPLEGNEFMKERTP